MSSPLPPGRFGRVAQHPGVVDEAGRTHPDRRHLGTDGGAQLLGHRRQGFDDEIEYFGAGVGMSRRVVLSTRCRDPHLGQHHALVVDSHAQHLGATHVDPDRHLPRHADLLCGSPVVGGGFPLTS